jgi:hypothetical protein
MFSYISREDILYDPVKGLLRFLQNLYNKFEFVQNSL